MTGVLPSYQRFVNGVPVPSITRRSFRLREKYLIISVLLTFGIVWLGALFYLPEFKSSNSVNDSVYSVYKRIQKAGPELLMPPPLAQNDVGEFPVVGVDHHHGEGGDDPHVIEDRNRLRAKIEEDMSMKVLERPQFDGGNIGSSSKKPSRPPVDALEEPAVINDLKDKESAPEKIDPYGADNQYAPVVLGPNAEPNLKEKLETVKQVLCALLFYAHGSYQRVTGKAKHFSQEAVSVYIQEVTQALNHPNILKRFIKFPSSTQERDTIKQSKYGIPGVIGCIDGSHFKIFTPCREVEHLYYCRKHYHSMNVQMMMRHAWSNYKLYAWGKNELKPISKRPHLSSVFGAGDLGATIVDGLDTLYIMGMKEEFQEGRDWIAESLDFENVDAELSVFETTIRFVGGLLSCYSLTGDTMFRDKAAAVADALLPAFETPTGLPYALINPFTKVSRQYQWAGTSSILSEIGTLHMEFTYLSDITGKSIYKEKVDRIRDVLYKIEKPGNLYPNFINPRTGQWGQRHISLGALGDSFYEYLLKAWLMSNKEDSQAREMFDVAMEAALEKMLHVSPNGLSYLVEVKYGRVMEEKMDHLSCFAGGMFALASTTLDNTNSFTYMDVAKKLTDTCHESYIRSDSKLGPEAFRFSGAVEARAQKSNEKVYLLRPETFESYFILWRLTKDQKYRDWGWEAVRALEKNCRVEGGYTGLSNVYYKKPEGDDVQQSFFLAETLKYLYLLFADDSVFPLDEWVFNTEAHPLPIKGKNPLYRLADKTEKASLDAPNQL